MRDLDALLQAGVLDSFPLFNPHYPGVDLRANFNSISYRFHLFEVALLWELTIETIHLPLECDQGGLDSDAVREANSIFESENIQGFLAHKNLPSTLGPP